MKTSIARVFLFVFCFFPGLIIAQNRDLSFNRITTASGLSQGHVSAILKDSRGFMWFATDGGLNKYDGYNFKVFKHQKDDSNSISHNIVYSLLEDHQKRLWAATHVGIDCYQSTSDQFIHYKIGKGLVVNGLFQDAQKRIWACTETGLYLYNTAKNQFQIFQPGTSAAVSLQYDYTYQITQDGAGYFWLATKNGLVCFNPDTKYFQRYLYMPGNDCAINSNWVKAVFLDSRGEIWAGTQEGGVSVYNTKTKCFRSFKHDPKNPASLSLNDILSFTEDMAGNVWVGTENGGINIYNPQTGSFSRYKNSPLDSKSLGGNSIYCFYRDNTGTVWIGTYSEGVNFVPSVPKKFQHYNQNILDPNALNDHSILSITADDDGIVWIGTDGGGLNRFDEKTGKFEHFMHDPANSNSVNGNYILSVIHIGKNLLGLGLHRGGFDIFNTKTRRFEHHMPRNGDANSLSTASVNITYQTRDGKVWLGTWGGGLDCFDWKNNRFRHYTSRPNDPASLTSNFIYCIYEDRQGNIWVGSGDGLDMLQGGPDGPVKHFKNNDLDEHSISQNFVQYLFQDSKGRLWIGTAGGLNLFDYKTETFSAITEKQGLPNDMVQSILEDKYGKLWLATNNGICRLDPETKKIKSYSEADGVQGKEFKPSSCYQDADGCLYFGGTNGFNIFVPDDMHENPNIPPVYLTGLQVFNKLVFPSPQGPISETISEAKEITLSYKQSVFSLEFAALDFNMPSKNQYSYRLQGFDANWSTPSEKHTVTYTNLDPGTYTFFVKGSNNDGLWNPEPRSITIVITPPWWRTWWFETLGALAAIAIILLIFRYRLRLMRQQKRLLQQKVDEQTLRLVRLNEEERNSRMIAEKMRAESEEARQETSQLNKALEIKNKELEQFAYAASHDLQEPLRMVTAFLSKIEKKYEPLLDEAGKTYIHFAVDGAKRMRQMILDLLEYSRVGRTGDQAELVNLNDIVEEVQILYRKEITDKNATIETTALPKIQTFKAPARQVFQNLVGNALKYSHKDRPPHISVFAEAQGKNWLFTVQDNGIGINEKYYESIFVLFKRIHSREEYSGTGIGLALTKKIIESMGGEIWVESVEGEGSTFSFTLPRS